MTLTHRAPRQCGFIRATGALFATALIALAQNTGTPPQPNLDASDIYAAFQLRLNDTPGSPAADAAAATQVWMRAHKLGITSHSAIDGWTTAQTLLTPGSAATTAAAAAITPFSGSTASALNELLMNAPTPAVRVISPSLTIDQPIRITRDGTFLDFSAAQLSASSPAPYMVRISGVHNATVTGGYFVSGNSAILIQQSNGVTVDHTQIANLSGFGIVVTGSSHITVTHNRIARLAGAGIFVHAGTSLSLVAWNQITDGTGNSNWTAGILVSDRDVDVSSDPRAIFDPSGFWPVAEPIRDRVNPPHDCLIADNHVATNASSGIYVDGSIRMTIYSNTIQGNAKEGLCLDNGATADVVASNVIQQNGKRWGQSDDTLRLDFVPTRLPDGTAAAKVPGVSIDNGLYNIVFGNNISHNFGGGVKMVRTGYFNIVGLNTIESDNEGVSSYFRFFGIELGAAVSDAPSPELDFTPSRGNILFSNVIRGSNASGVFIGNGSNENQISDNVIMDATDYALESVASMSNDSQNNLTNTPSINISNGCCTLTDRRPPLRPAAHRPI